MSSRAEFNRDPSKKQDPRIAFMARAIKLSARAYKLAGLLCWQYGNKGGAIFPSQKTLGDDLGVTERYVRTLLKELESVGLIIEMRRGPRTGTRVSYYKFGEPPDPAIPELDSGTDESEFRNWDDNNSGTPVPPNQKREPKDRTKDPDSTSEDVESGESARASNTTRLMPTDPEKHPVESSPRRKKTSARQPTFWPKPERGTRIPENWKPSPADFDFARQKGLSPPETADEADKFADYWLSASGSSAIKKDWAAAWRNWVRNALEFRARDAARERARSAARSGYRRRTPEDLAADLELGGALFEADQLRRQGWGTH